MIKIKQIKFNKHWGSLAKGYLKLAEQGFLYLKNQKNIGRKKLFSDKKSIYLLEDGNLIIASIWNIKHGIELIIKGLGINLNKEYWQKHDLGFLIVDLENKLKQYCIKRDLNLLKKIVDKYYRCKFSSKTIFTDKENTFLKYPESNNVSLNYSFVHDLRRKDINQFLKDIHNLKRLYNIIENQPGWFKKAKEWGMSKDKMQKELLSVPTMKNPGYKK